MAQWSRKDRTLHTKLVYYGPAYGGKTTNLQSLHRITDPKNKQQLLSVKTADDRTLFFDLLPFDLGDILGYQVAMKLYTVPGQVRYDTTRQVVLAGTDAIVFVADSTSNRRDQNVWSQQNLQMNMRAKGLDPKRVPVLYQFNKQDLPEAAAPEEVADWLQLPVEQGFPAVAVDGKGVLETFMAACRIMLERLVERADDRTRREIDTKELARQIDRAFGPYMVRRDAAQAPAVAMPEPADSQIVLGGNDLLERAVQTGVRLGDQLSKETGRATRLEKEADAFRRLSESLRSVGATFDRERIIDAALESTAEILGAPVATLVHRSTADALEVVRVSGHEADPLIGFADGRCLLDQMLRAGGPCVVDDIVHECPGIDAAAYVRGLRAVASVPVESAGRGALVVYAAQPDGAFRPHDVRFLATVAGHLAAGLEKARLHEELAQHRDRLEETVAARTEELRKAYDDLRSLDEMKDRFLSNISHEMKTPLTAVLSAAFVLRDYDNSPTETAELVRTIVSSAEASERLLEDLLRLVNLEGGETLRPAPTTPERVVEEAAKIAGLPDAPRVVGEGPAEVQVDLSRIARALANLLDNAVKFSASGDDVEIRLTSTDADLRISILDRGPGVPAADRARIFAPFEQGGSALCKPAGIGLGLYEALTIARGHGGSVEYLPRDGGGSEFCMTLPLEPAPVEGAPETVHA